MLSFLILTHSLHHKPSHMSMSPYIENKEENRRWFLETDLVTLEDVTDHLGSLLDAISGIICGQDSPPGHQHHQVSDVCDVGDGAEGVVHHDLLQGALWLAIYHLKTQKT